MPSAGPMEPAESQIIRERVMAFMTLGSVAFQMSLFYLTHHRDEDMKRYAFTTIGQTISIFVSVLSFSAIYGFIERYIHQHLSKQQQTMVYPCLALLFFVGMESVVTIWTNVKGERAEKHVVVGGRALHMLASVLNAKTYGTAAAQMCGAAAIRGFGHLQLVAFHEMESLALAFAVVPFAAMVLIVTIFVASSWRKCMARCFPNLVANDKASLKHWAEVSQECENEVFALCVAFLGCTAMRAWSVHSFPEVLVHHLEHGDQEQHLVPGGIRDLWAFSCLCCVSCMTLNVVLFEVLTSGAHTFSGTIGARVIHRIAQLVTLTTGFAFAWSLSFGLHLVALNFGTGLQMRLALALFTSIAAFVVVSVLDALADSECTGHHFKSGIVMIINSLGVSIGLSWEHAFHACVDVCVEFMAETDWFLFQLSDDPNVWAFFLSLFVVMMVLPAFRWFIVPTMYSLTEQYEDQVKQTRCAMGYLSASQVFESEAIRPEVVEASSGIESVQQNETTFVFVPDLPTPSEGLHQRNFLT